MPKFLKRLQSMRPLAAFLNAAGPQREKRKKPQGQKVKSKNGSRYFLKYNLNLETNWKCLKYLEIQLFKLTPMKPSTYSTCVMVFTCNPRVFMCADGRIKTDHSGLMPCLKH